MTRQETIQKLIETLRPRRQEVKQMIGEFEQSLAIDFDGDLADRAMMNEQLAVYLRLAETELQELKLIEAALLRHKKRKYGVCETCKRNIPLNRLRALPYAKQCAKCKQKMESGTSNSAFPSVDMQDGLSIGDFVVYL